MSYRSRGHVIGISLTTITHSIIFPFTEFNSSRPRLVAAVCQDLKKINSAETIRGNTVCGISDVATASVHSEKTRVKKWIMIIIIMNKSQELTVFHGRQKLTSAKS